MNKGKILLVDNLEHARQALGDMLTLTGYQVHTAGSPDEAKEVLQREPVHLAVIDLRLLDHFNERDTSGITLAGELDPLIPCIIITAFEREIGFEVVRKALGSLPTGRAPAVDFIAKSESPRALLEAIARAFREKVRVNFDLKVTLEGQPSLQPLVEKVASPERRVDLGFSTDEIEEELRELLQKLFYEDTAIDISLRLPLMAEEAGTVIVRRYRQGQRYGASMLVRFGEREAIDRELKERQGWELPELEVIRQRDAFTWHWGGIAYAFRRTYPALSVLSLTCCPEEKTFIDFRGSDGQTFAAQTVNPVHIDVNLYTKLADDARRSSDWRFKVKDIGQRLDRELFTDQPEVRDSYHRAVGMAKGKRGLKLVFKADRDSLRVPLEFLFLESEYAVLSHPLSRFVLNTNTLQDPISPGFFERLRRRSEEFKILLIAANTEPPIPGVDEEIEALATSLGSLLKDNDIAHEITYLPTEKATLERVKGELRRCQHHILHYAGHGYYEHEHPEQSSLYFWHGEGRSDPVEKLTAQAMGLLVRDSQLRFAYLSCCSGAASGGEVELLSDDFLGLADALIQKGVPAILGFRWPVSDQGARQLALSFYESLFEQGDLATALLEARCEIAGQRGRDDETWLSPILIVQE